MKLRLHVSEFEATGRDWQIFSWKAGDSLYRNEAHYKRVVNRLNLAVIVASVDAVDREDFVQRVYKVMDRHSKFGATDTEPRGFLASVADRIYGAPREARW